MIKFKKKMKYIKGFILYALLCVFAFMPFMSFNVNAWSLGSDGNLHSDNILTFVDGSHYGLGVTYVCEDNKITLNGTATSSGPLWVNINIEPGTYTFQAFNDFTYNDGFRLTLRNGYDRTLASCSYDTLNNYNTYTSTYSATILAITVVSGVNYNNVVLTPSLVVGSTPLKEYEPYGDVYYSQSNYDNAGYNILGGLESFDAINLYYSSSMTFVSTDGGNTYFNANNQDVSNTLVTNSDGSRSLLINKDNPWGYTNYYYVHVDFSYPVFLWRLRILNAVKPTDFIKVVVNDREITKFDYKPNIDGSSYIVSDDIYQQTNSVDFYFIINGYTAQSNRSFVLGYDGYNVGVDSYRQGYEKGQEDLQPKIEALEDKVIMLSNDNENLRVQLGENFGWQNLFFTMADTPFYTISNMLNFEVLGLNLFQALIGFITIIAIVWILKRLVK